MQNDTFRLSSFYQITALVCLAFVPFVEWKKSLIVIRLTRISYLDMLLAVVTQYTMFFDCIESRRS